MSDWITEGDISDFGGTKSLYPTIEVFIHIGGHDAPMVYSTSKDPDLSLEELVTQAAYRAGATDDDRCFIIDIMDKDGIAFKEAGEFSGMTAADLNDGSRIYIEVDTVIDYSNEDLSEL